MATDRSFKDWLREICVERQTGRLSVTSDHGEGDLFFVGGELYLGPESPVFEAAKAWVDESGMRGAADGAEVLETIPIAGALAFRQLAGTIIEQVGGDEDGQCSFSTGASQIRLDLVGPLPTRQLLMECAVWSLDEQGLLRGLGGEEVVMRATADPGHPFSEIELDPQEAFLLSRLEHPVTVGEFLNQLDLDRVQVLQGLCRLAAVDLIASAMDVDSREGDQESKDRLVERFGERIGQSLEEEPLEIGRDQHRELLRSLLSRMGEMTHFELLAVTPQSGDEEIHNAFLELGRLVHPSHATTLGLAGKEGAFGVLFERATDAYVTLSDPDRKTRYAQDLGPLSQSSSKGPSDEIRSKEKQEVARQNYEMALALTDRQDFHSAIQLLEQAVKVDPQPEYLTLLGDCQAENPSWLDRAAFNYQWALQVRPGDAAVLARLGRAHERRGETVEARQAYESALRVAPSMESARAGLLRVGGGQVVDQKLSFSQRLLSILRGKSGL